MVQGAAGGVEPGAAPDGTLVAPMLPIRAAAILSLSALLLGCRTNTTAVGAEPTTGSRDDAGSKEKAAQAAAEAWLSLVDAGSYGQSWTGAADLFKKRVDQGTWEKTLEGVRGPLGKMQSRTVRSARYATSLPGAPDGEYVVVQFDTSFEKKSAGVETVTPMIDLDGRWRVSGYFIK
jgi:hypothetical protein